MSEQGGTWVDVVQLLASDPIFVGAAIVAVAGILNALTNLRAK